MPIREGTLVTRADINSNDQNLSKMANTGYDVVVDVDDDVSKPDYIDPTTLS